MNSVDIQKAFARDIRTAGEEPYSDDPRMKIYRDLFFNNVCGFIDGTFPVCAEIVGAERWRALSAAFFRQHPCKTPYFLKICEEFLAWLSAHSDEWSDLPFLAELAHYEWLELAVDVMDVPVMVPREDDDVLTGIPELNPALVFAGYRYPVQQISADNIPEAESPVAMIVYRDTQPQVRFVQLNAVSAGLFMRIQAGGVSGINAVEGTLAEIGMQGSEAAFSGGTEILRDWHEKGIILGAERAS